MPSLKKRAWLLLAASITLQLVILRSTRALKDDAPLPQTLTRRLLKRGAEESYVSVSEVTGLIYRKLSSPCHTPTGILPHPMWADLSS